MSKFKAFALAAVVTSAMALPALAQPAPAPGMAPKQATTKMPMKRHAMHRTHHVHVYHHQARYDTRRGYDMRRDDRMGYGWNDGRDDFGPFGLVGGIVGGAAATAGAIATAPFGGPQYGWGGGPQYGWSNANAAMEYPSDGFLIDPYYRVGFNGGRFNAEYAKRNGITCQPGTWIKGWDDGRMHICQ